MPCARRSGRGREEVVAEQLHVRAEQLGDERARPPSRPRRADLRSRRAGSGAAQPRARRERGAVKAAILAREAVAVAVDELRGRDVERERGLDAGALDAARRDLERLLVGGQRRREAALVGHERRRVAALAQLAAAPARTRAAYSMASANVVARERDHEHVLDVDARAGVGAAREQVDHRPRQQRGGSPGRAARQSGAPSGLGGGQRAGDRGRQDGVGAEPRERRRAVEVAQGGVDRRPGRRRRAHAGARRSRR